MLYYAVHFLSFISIQIITCMEVIQHYKEEKSMIGAHPGINPGLLFQDSDTLTTRLRGQIQNCP